MFVFGVAGGLGSRHFQGHFQAAEGSPGSPTRGAKMNGRGKPKITQRVILTECMRGLLLANPGLPQSPKRLGTD